MYFEFFRRPESIPNPRIQTKLQSESSISQPTNDTQKPKEQNDQQSQQQQQQQQSQQLQQNKDNPNSNDKVILPLFVLLHCHPTRYHLFLVLDFQ
jgi:hypothetical protein